MLFLLAPSKTMDTQPPSKSITVTEPLFPTQAVQIVSVIKQRDDIASLMKVSSTIAENVVDMYKVWGEQTKAAIYLYRGDVYKGFYADTLDGTDRIWAQTHLMILSGLYGLVRPLDAISRYRLEMKAPIALGGARNLYEFWGSQLAEYADAQSDGIICLLTSEEYARPIRKYSKSRLVTPIFMDHKPNGKVGPVPIYSKMMRGVMARWVIDVRADTPEKLQEFTGFDYYYDAARSGPDTPVFVRQQMTPLQF